jgi:hypothetical protein
MSENTISTPAAAAKGDDRNLVPVDPAGALSFEDQAFLIWKKQRTFIIGTLVAVVALLIGWFAFQGIQESREAAVRTAFGQATTIDAKRTFAREHAGHALAGVALLAVADDSYAGERYEDAAREYASASAVLVEPLLLGRARIGEGAANLRTAQTAQGEQQLTKVAEDVGLLMSHRLQAWYLLASHAAGAGDPAKARDMIGRLKALDPASEWANLASALQVRLDTEQPVGASDLPPAPAPAMP